MKSMKKRSPVRVNPLEAHPLELRRSLDGRWDFALDPEDVGKNQGWERGDWESEHTVNVPGCWQGQGIGHDGTEEVWDFRLSTRTLRATYSGTGWYRRIFTLPLTWRGKRIWLNFGGVNPSAEIWLNGEPVGSHSSPFVPFAFDVTDLVRCDGGNTLVVRVHELDRWLGFSYNWQGKWSGLYRSVELSATGDEWIQVLRLQGDLEKGRINAMCLLGSADRGHGMIEIRIEVTDRDGRMVACHALEVDPRDHRVEFSLPVESPLPWSPDAPNLYSATVELRSDGQIGDALKERFGFVSLSTRGKHFLINGEPYYMRGSGDFSACPETGSPDTDRDRWRRKLSTLKEYGYNYVRCQSYVPTPEYLDAADEVGLIVQGEMGMLGAWAGSSPWHVYAWPQPSPHYREKLEWQWLHTVERDVNHPCAAIYCMSNELGAETLYPKTAWRCYHDTKAIKPQAMVIWTDGGYSPDLPGDFVNAEATMDAECDKPVIQHEFRWWSAYPDPRIRHKYSGGVRPYAIDLARHNARENGAESLLARMTESSQRLQYVESRGRLEACRRDNPTLAGICHFNAMDIGYSPQGILDEFYDPKGTPGEVWLRSWGDTVLMIDRDFDDRVLLPGDLLAIRLSVSDFSHPPFSHPKARWEFLIDNRVQASGDLEYRHRPFRTTRVGRIGIKLPNLDRPRKAILRAELSEEGKICRNEWSFWIMPASGQVPMGIAIYGKPKATWLRHLKGIPRIGRGELTSRKPRALLSESLNKEIAEYVKSGGRLALAASEGLVRPFGAKLGARSGRYFFLPPANYPPYENGQSGTIIEDHPALGHLPHDGYADLQLYRPIADSPPIDLRRLGGWSVDPIIRAISTYFVFHPLAYLVEFELGKGGVLICSLDLDQRWPECRVLLDSMARYLTGEKIQTNNRMSHKTLDRLLTLVRPFGE